MQQAYQGCPAGGTPLDLVAEKHPARSMLCHIVPSADQQPITRSMADTPAQRLCKHWQASVLCSLHTAKELEVSRLEVVCRRFKALQLKFQCMWHLNLLSTNQFTVLQLLSL